MAAGHPPHLAVLIDADNVPAQFATDILKEIATLGEASVRRVYGDWSNPALGSWKKQAQELGLVMHQQSANTRGKNASDIGLVIDAMDILHRGKVGGFVLVSSDSDFTRLASRIREDGVLVYGIGEQKTPLALRQACNRFLFIENIVATDGEGREASARPKDGQPATPKQSPSGAVPLVRRAMKQINPEETEYSLGLLGQVINQLQTDFDTRSYGSQKLSDLLTKTGVFEVFVDASNHWRVRERKAPKPRKGAEPAA